MEAEKEAVQQFPTTREAKEFLVGRILSQAKREGIPLSDDERKMLYFSETAWTLPDMSEVSTEFDRHYDQDEFERKIAGLVRNIVLEPTQDQGDERSWDNAVRVLRREDHYLLVMIDAANRQDEEVARRPPGDFVKLILTALLIIAAMLAAMFLFKGR